MTNKMTAVLIEDDDMIRFHVETLIREHSNIELLASFSDAETAKNFLKSNSAYVVFLDVELPGMSGIEFIETTENIDQVIIISSHKSYAADAYDYNVLDYLVKPVKEDRFETAIKKLEESHQSLRLENNDTIYVKSGTDYYPVNIGQLTHIEALSDYVQLYQNGAERITYLATMKSVEARLSEFGFMRVHRSFIVNLNLISRIKDNVIYIDDIQIPVGRSYREKLRSVISIWK